MGKSKLWKRSSSATNIKNCKIVPNENWSFRVRKGPRRILFYRRLLRIQSTFSGGGLTNHCLVGLIYLHFACGMHKSDVQIRACPPAVWRSSVLVDNRNQNFPVLGKHLRFWGQIRDRRIFQTSTCVRICMVCFKKASHWHWGGPSNTYLVEVTMIVSPNTEIGAEIPSEIEVVSSQLMKEKLATELTDVDLCQLELRTPVYSKENPVVKRTRKDCASLSVD